MDDKDKQNMINKILAQMPDRDNNPQARRNLAGLSHEELKIMHGGLAEIISRQVAPKPLTEEQRVRLAEAERWGLSGLKRMERAKAAAEAQLRGEPFEHIL